MKTKVVVIGGGTGSFTILKALKEIKDVSITAIVPSSDSGGSTGRLRDEFGLLPVGDLRQCIIALTPESEEKVLRDLFSYRFSKGGDGLNGHNFGNLFITALSDILNSEEKAIHFASQLLKVKGKIYPISLSTTDLKATYENGEVILGEHNIDEPKFPHDSRLRIENIELTEKPKANPKVMTAIKEADYIITGPGDLYTSLIPNFLFPEVSTALKESTAKFIFILNLVTKFGQTFNFKASDFVEEITKYSTRKPDYILINTKAIPELILEKYTFENSFPVIDDLNGDINTIREDLISDLEYKKNIGDSLHRSLLRHDPEKLRDVLKSLFKNKK